MHIWRKQKAIYFKSMIFNENYLSRDEDDGNDKDDRMMKERNES